MGDRVTIQVESGRGTTTIVIKGELDELTGLDACCEIEELVVGSNRAWRFTSAFAPARKPSGADT